MTTHNGIHIADQTTGGGNNPSPHGILEDGTAPNQFGGPITIVSGGLNVQTGTTTLGGLVTISGHINQNATGNFAGVCIFAAATTCTIIYASAYTSTPAVFLQPVNPGGFTFTLTSSSNTGFTITGSSSNSITVNWLAIGNTN